MSNITSTQNLKPITKEAVKNYSEKVFKSLGYVTTLDIKNELRKDGYWAVQSDISKMVDEISNEENWDWTVESNYRVYHLNLRPESTIISIKRYAIEDWIKENCSNKFFGVLFIKKDGSERKMVCRLGVKKGVKGTSKFNVQQVDNWNHILRVFDVNADNSKDPNIRGDYRNINLETLKEVRFKNTIVKVI